MREDSLLKLLELKLRVNFHIQSLIVVLQEEIIFTRKIERFSVIEGSALIELRKIGDNKIYSFVLSGENPSFVDMPVWYTHNIKNISDNPLTTLFWINEPYNEEDPDTFYENV